MSNCNCNTLHIPKSQKTGKSFNFSIWDRFSVYENNEEKQDFVEYEKNLYACIKSVGIDDINPKEDTEDGQKCGEYWVRAVSGIKGDKGSNIVLRINDNWLQWKYDFEEIAAYRNLYNFENVIEQLKIAVTYIGEFIYSLQDWFENINVYSVAGNHSRLNPNKDEHLKGEELEEMIPFCLKLQFANNDKIAICDCMASKIDSTISAFKTRGNKLFYVVHGDHDTPSNVVKNLTLMSGQKPDGIIMGHRHNNALSTEHGVKIIQCGSVVGTDDYCVDKRISGEPEQCVFITSEHRTVKCLYDIGLN